MTTTRTIRMLTRYKAWANDLIFSAVSELPYEEAIKQRNTRFGNIVHTLNHVYVIDDVFQAHLQGREHGYTARNTREHPPLDELWRAVRTLDQWYIDYADGLSAEDLDQPIHFNFIGGGEGVMTRNERILHVVNHGTYHRGFVSTLMFEAGVSLASNDLPVFLRDVPQIPA